MRAALCRNHGTPDEVTVEEIESPACGAAEVRVAVQTAAVNFPDVLVVANSYQIKVPVPFVPGSEFAGEITEVGANIDHLNVGDRVFGSALYGAFAQEIVSTAQQVTRIPAGVAIDVAAAFGVAHRTAYNTLRTVAKLQPGEELIVLGAGGGVGLAAVQLGALLGATVTAVASSPAKLAAAEACGATRLVDYREADLRQQLRGALPEGADVVVDPVGGEVSEPAVRALRYGGRFVTVGYASGTIPKIPLNLVLLKGIQILGFEFRGFATHYLQDMMTNEQELLEHFGAGRVAPYVEARFSLDEVVAALQHLAGGKAIGKVLLDIS